MAGRQVHAERVGGPSRWAAWGRFGAGVVVGALLVGMVWCGWGTRAPAPVVVDHAATAVESYAWTDPPAPAFPIPPYAEHLRGVTIVLDPGHVGQRDPGGNWKRGPTGLREAEANLRVAHFLREFLEAVGAEVVLTRSEDRSLDLPDDEDLRQRAEVANEARADLLLSIHHNGSSTPTANYTSLFYHSGADWEAASRCAARALLAGLNDAMRLESHLPCAMLSDRVLYENGLAVLRAARVPAVLTEASFHSNPEEEARLRDPVYNRREAYGLFLGLAQWAQAGLPRVRLVRPADGRVRAGDELVVALEDGLSDRGGWGAERSRIVADSLRVWLDGERVAHQFDARAGTVKVPVAKRYAGRTCTLRVDFANVYGQHVGRPHVEVEVVAK